MTIDERRERARSWLEAIHHDVQDLVIDVHIFWKVQEIIKKNDRLKVAQSHFFHWMMAAHVESAAVGVRRQVKPDRKSISLRGFLEEVKRYPEIVSRAHYVSLALRLDPVLPAQFHERTFDSHVGNGMQAFDPNRAQAEIDLIKSVTAKVEHLADRRFAHYDRRGVQGDRPTFDDIGNSLRAFEDIIKRYKLLLEGASADLLPTFQYDWEEIFRYPWIMD